RFGMGPRHRAARPGLVRIRVPRGAGVPDDRLPAQYGRCDGRGGTGAARAGDRDPVVMAPGPAAVVLLVLLAWPAARSSAQTLTVDTTGEWLKIATQGFSFLAGDPLVRLKDGQSVRVE